MLSNPGGFSVRVAGARRNLLANPSFELDTDRNKVPDDWRLIPGSGRLEPTTAQAESGKQSIKVSLVRQGVSPGLAATIAVTPSTNYVLSAWFRSENVKPTIPPAVRETYHPHSPIQVEAAQTSRGQLRIVAAHGYSDTAGWNRQFVGFKTGPDVHRVTIRGLIRNGSGTAWFDDLSVTKLFPRRPILVGGSLDASASTKRQHSAVATDSLSMDATYRSGADNVRVDGAISSSSRRDVAVQVAYTLPLDATGWEWADDARRTRKIRRGSYGFLSNSSLQQTSVYPFGAVFDDRSMLAIGVPLSRPRMFRVEYVVGRGLTVTFDLGLSGAQAAGPRADFSFIVYTADPSWGFRSATRAYYDLNPQSFVHRTDPSCEGSWFVAPPLNSIDDSYRQFGLGLNMAALGKASSQSYNTWGTRYIKWDDDRGIYTSAYGHHWAFYQPIGRSARSPSPAYGEVIRRLRSLANNPATTMSGVRLRDEARAALRSTQRDFNGRLYYERYGKFLAYYEDLDHLGAPTLDWPGATQRYQVQKALQTARDADGRLDGLHLDSTSGMRRWGASDDYDRRHWAASTLPLTLSYDSGMVTQRGIFPIYGHLADMADFVHRRRMILSANFNADLRRTAGFFGADTIDYFGIEQGLQARDVGGTVDQFALWKRTLAYQRPISTLDARIGMGSVSPQEIDHQLQQNLFYGIFAGAWNPKVEADGTGAGVAWTRKPVVRLWARYTPTFRRLARAGWEPVTNARSSDRSVWVERFGHVSAGPVLFTVRNETRIARQYRLSLDLTSLGAPSGVHPFAIEDVTGKRIPMALEPQRMEAVIADTIAPDSTRVFAVTFPS